MIIIRDKLIEGSFILKIAEEMKFFICLCCILFTSNAFSYLYSNNQSGAVVRWPSNVSLIDVFTNPTNTQGLSENDVNYIIGNAIEQWDAKSRLTIRENNTAGTNQEYLNEIYFSTDPTYFNGSGVVGITLVTFNSSSGEIIEGDVLINDNFTFSLAVNDDNYLGNVVTHELGHFLGLSHGQVLGSTMFYSLSRGQSGLSADDVAGVYTLYPYNDSSKGTLHGRVVGSSNLIGVFGAHVQALSLKTGKIAGANITNEKGEFSIGGLNISDYYYIYVAPMNLNGSPDKYDVVKNNFCSRGSSYRGSFFTACGASKEGFPQAIKLTTKDLYVGNVTISCDLSVPPLYISSKNTTPATFDLQNNVLSGIGNSFVGYFSAQEIQLGNKLDYFKIDLSQIDWADVSPTGNLYLELKILNQLWYSPFKANVNIRRDSLSLDVAPKYVLDSDGGPNIDTNVRVAIDRLTPSDNVFEVTITPESMVDPLFPTGIPYGSEDYFPSMDEFMDPLYFYLAQFSIVKDFGAGSFGLISFKNESLSDNSYCAEAPGTFPLSAFTLGQSSNSKKKSSVKSESAVSCGSVVLLNSSNEQKDNDDDNDDSGEGASGKLLSLKGKLRYLISFLFGLFATYVLLFLSFKTTSLSRKSS